MYIDYTRECITRIDFYPKNTIDYCASDRYVDCPFYKTLNNIGFCCEFIAKCAAYKYFGVNDFENFVKITRKYCLSEEGSLNCKRYQLRKSGQFVQENLHPDGGELK